VKDIPIEVWVALIALLGGVVGVSVGAFLQRRAERQHWERTVRLDAYDGYLSAFDEFLNQLRQKPVNIDKSETAKELTVQCLTRVSLVGSEEGIHGARNALFQLGLLQMAGVLVSRQGMLVNYGHGDFKDILEQRLRFITAARADIKVNPAAVPAKVVLPLTPESEETDEDRGSDRDDRPRVQLDE
jgi:hypothetical protein